MEDRLTAHEVDDQGILANKARPKQEAESDDPDMDLDLLELSAPPLEFSDVLEVGSKVVIGAGLGLLAGVATIAVMASLAEIIVAGVVTKIAGVVGGGAGLTMGLRQLRSRREKKA
jgi:hypothetical protein